MGIFLSFVGYADVSDVFIDFENATYNDDDERHVCSTAEKILLEAPDMIEMIQNYSSCGSQIRRALVNPNPEVEREAFLAVNSNAAIIQRIFYFSKAVASIARELLRMLATGHEKSSFCSHQLTVKQYGSLLDFVLRFDEVKMSKPGIQNDFSYYRRILSKHSNDPDLQVKDEEASFISLYIAQPTPMMATLAKATSSLYISNDNVPQAIALISNVCQELVKTKRFGSQQTNLLLVRIMIASIVLFDHISLKGGAFGKTSGINIKPAIKLVKEYPDNSSLINMLRYSTLHLNDESTPSSIRALLGGNK